jgi:hypothetical protein
MAMRTKRPASTNDDDDDNRPKIDDADGAADAPPSTSARTTSGNGDEANETRRRRCGQRGVVVGEIVFHQTILFVLVFVERAMWLVRRIRLIEFASSSRSIAAMKQPTKHINQSTITTAIIG